MKTQTLRDAMQETYGEKFCEETFKKALSKLKRWMVAAHGGVAWEELDDPVQSLDCYYQETLNDKTGGLDTFNRQGFGKGLTKKEFPMTPSGNMRAVLIICENPRIGARVKPYLNIERDTMDWEGLMAVNKGADGGLKTALSWMYCLWCDNLPPKSFKLRDPFDGFGSLDRDVQLLIIKAMASRYELTKIS